MVGRDALIAAYMMASGYRGTIYIGVTSELVSRVVAHREGRLPGFTQHYRVKRLVWFEQHELMTDAMQREKSLKRWPRQRKINLIERDNPRWDDLFRDSSDRPGYRRRSGIKPRAYPFPPSS